MAVRDQRGGVGHCGLHHAMIAGVRETPQAMGLHGAPTSEVLHVDLTPWRFRASPVDDMLDSRCRGRSFTAVGQQDRLELCLDGAHQVGSLVYWSFRDILMREHPSLSRLVQRDRSADAEIG